VLIGKAAMIELAGGLGYRFASASATGAAKNPWNEDHWTCGSSSGSAAVVGAGLAGFAIGTETWGSILCPSGFCGVSGLRPTFGRVSRAGAMALSFSMDKIGPMARCIEDCDLILKAIAGHDPQDAGSLPEAAAHYSGAGEMKKPLRVGWMTNQWKEKETAAEVATAAKAAREVLQKHPSIQMSEVALPDGPWETAGGTIVSVEATAAFRELIQSGHVAELSDPVGRIGGYMGETISASDFITAQRLRDVVQKKMAEIFTRVDVLAAATLPVTAPKIDVNLDDGLSFGDPIGGIGNITGLPAISVPCGFGEGNLPIGIQFIASPQEDAKAVQAAALFQSQTDWHTRHPHLA
jgi:aspartyl-tRNA(Asn)/glutamyl-tRNA(Gln) amidotransferase subunit A